MTQSDDSQYLARIAAALERLAPAPRPMPDLGSADAFVWDAENKNLISIAKTQHIELSLLQGIEQVRDLLLANTLQFSKGYSANNALLWGARGMGKSSLVKAIHAHINAKTPGALALVEIHREDISHLPQLIQILRHHSNRRFVLYCDDLSFDQNDSSYKSLKTVLEGGLEGRPEHILFYATSNRRHLMPRDMIENERSTAIHPGEAVEEKTSLSDRFGLLLGFHSCSQETYLQIIDSYTKYFGVKANTAQLHADALEWAATRGARSGRVAWQFMQDLAGKLGQKIA